MTADDDAAGEISPDTSVAGGDVIGREDIALLNGQAVERAGAFARLAGSALIVVGSIGVVAWSWLTVRRWVTVDDFEGFSNGFEGQGPDVSLVDRLDLVANYVPLLVYGAVATGVGCALRLLADYTVARTGGSLSGFVVGDPVPADDPDPVEVEPFAQAGPPR
jgi:hypothetical protein